MSDLDEVRWAPRVPRDKIRRLYASDACGRLDEELLDDVLVSLYLRCQSILTIAQANQGHVKCPRCKTAFEIASRGGHILLFDGDVPRRPTAPDAPPPADERLCCPGCGWSVMWSEYCRTWRGKKLNVGGAAPAIMEFTRDFAAGGSAHAKLMRIDRLIHAFHLDMELKPVRPVACNVIEGNLGEVVTLIMELAYGDVSLPELSEQRETWKRQLPAWVRKHVGQSVADSAD